MIRNLLYKGFGFLGQKEARAFEEGTQNPGLAQTERLMNIISSNIDSAFGRDHNFGNISSVKDFQQAVPIRDYDGLQSYIDRAVHGEHSVLTTEDPIMFATTSGTTGSQKFIPITPGYMQEFRRASVVSGFHLLRNFPGIANGNTLSVVSPAEEGRTPGGLPYGAISGMLFQKEPWLIRKFIAPVPYELYLTKNYEARYYALLRLALALPLSCFYTLNPSTIVLLARRLKQNSESLIKDVGNGTLACAGELTSEAREAIKHLLKPDPQRAAFLEKLAARGEFVPHKIWPTLQVVSCWTRAAASFYLNDFPEFFGDVPVCDISYGASEGRGTIFYAPDKQVLALRSHFFEFVPEEEMGSTSPTALVADQLEEGRNYYVLFTTSGGFYRYNINDVVKVVGFHNRAPLLEFQYKGGNISSFTGEKLTELQVTMAMRAVMEQMGLRVRFFTLVPTFRPEPHYRLWIEFDGLRPSTDDLMKLTRQFDVNLGVENVEYLAKRQSHRLGDVVPEVLIEGTYEEFRRMLTSRGIPDAQIKISHLNPKDETTEHLRSKLLSGLLEGTAAASV